MKSKSTQAPFYLIPPNLISKHRYLWGFLLRPKKETGAKVYSTSYRVKNDATFGWGYDQEMTLAHMKSSDLLARIMIAKMQDEQRLIEILRNTTIGWGDPN